MTPHAPRVQLTETSEAPLYVVQPLPLLDIYALAVLSNTSTEGLSEQAIAAKVFKVASECMKVRRRWHDKMQKAGQSGQ